MNKHLNATPIRKIIGAGLLAVSLAALTGCAGDATEAAPAPAASAPAIQTPEPREDLLVRLVQVVDGDTIEVEPISTDDGQPNGEPALTVHMLGVAAPEGTACGSAESTATLGTLIRPKEPITVSYEPSLAAENDADGHAWGYVSTGSGVSQDIGFRMVNEGYALASYPEGEIAAERFEAYEKAAKSAAEQGLGNWTTCGTQGN